MTAIPLFGKPVSAAHQLDQWLERGRREVFAVTTMLTPELSKLLLANNPGNRPLIVGAGGGVRSVLAYADMMTRGAWTLNGAPLVVSATGELNDGQHRCEAVQLAGVAVPVQIVFGVDRDTRMTLDQGIARTTGTILAMTGVKDGNVVAVYLRFRVAAADGRGISQALTPDEALAAYELFPPYHNYTVPIGGWAKRSKLSVGFMVGAHALCMEANPLAAAAYADQVSTGVGITSITAPAARIRKAVEAQNAVRNRQDASKGRTPAFNFAALYVLGFNNFCRGRTGPLTWRDKDVREPFPVPVSA